MKFDLAIHPAHVNLRKWPYPFQAGLTISNDAEFMSDEVLDELLQYVNGTKSTQLGIGLGLQLSSSLFFFSESSASVFSGLAIKADESDWAVRAAELIKDGLIDTNHAFGEFDDSPTFERAHAQRAYEWMAAKGVKLGVFSNHGGTTNHQNIGRDASYHQGDLRASQAYHSDLFPVGDVQFAWTDSKSYESIEIPARELVGPVEPLAPPSRRQRLFGRVPPPIQQNEPVRPPPEKRILELSTLQDEASIQTFMRFRGTNSNAPNVSSFYSQISRLISDGFYQRQGGVVVYQHFGVLFREAGQCSRTTIEALKQNPAGFLSAWRILAREVHEGRLWMPTQERFLRYVRANESISLDQQESGVVAIRSSTSGLTAADLEGITIYVETTKPIRVEFGGMELLTHRNGPDETGRYSVTIKNTRSGAAWS